MTAVDLPMTTTTDHTAVSTSGGEPVSEGRSSGVSTSRFARPGTGWAEVGRGLTAAAEAVVGHHHGAPLPCGDPVAVLSAVTEAIGVEGIPETGVGESEALRRICLLYTSDAADE